MKILKLLRRKTPKSVERQMQAEPFDKWFKRLNPDRDAPNFNDTWESLSNLRKQINDAKREGLL